jgi:hypothetical protein
MSFFGNLSELIEEDASVYPEGFVAVERLVAEVVGPLCGVWFAVCLEGEGFEVEAYIADAGVDVQEVENA